MSHKQLMIAFAIWVVVFLTVGAVMDARADSKDELALLLARTCVAEIGFKGTVEECHLMWRINRDNAIKKKRSIKRQTKLFNSYWKCKTQRRRRPWIKHLEGPEKPKHWPSTMEWSMFRDKWLEYEAAAIAFVASQRNAFHGCDDAIDYGAPGEIPAMRNMEQIKCLGGKTRQRYWRVRKK